VRNFLSRIKSVIRRTIWRFSSPSMQYVVAVVGRIGIGTVEEFSEHFNMKTEDIGKLFQDALDAKLISPRRHLCIKQEVFVPTEKGLRLGAREGLLSESLVGLGPCRVGRRNVIRWMTRMRLALEFERLGLEVRTTQELLAERRSTHAAGRSQKRSRAKRARRRNGTRRPDLRVRAGEDVPWIDVNVQFNIPIFKRKRRELVRNNGTGVIWIAPTHMANRMQQLLWGSNQNAAICLGLGQAVKGLGSTPGNVVIALNAAGKSLLPVKRFTLHPKRNVRATAA
jgi:hypothetical protein